MIGQFVCQYFHFHQRLAVKKHNWIRLFRAQLKSSLLELIFTEQKTDPGARGGAVGAEGSSPLEKGDEKDRWPPPPFWAGRKQRRDSLRSESTPWGVVRARGQAGPSGLPEVAAPGGGGEWDRGPGRGEVWSLPDRARSSNRPGVPAASPLRARGS